MRIFSYTIGLFVLFSQCVCAGDLPKNISTTEFDRIVEVLGYGSATRLMRSAEAYPPFPGFKLGVELALTPTKGINAMGDQTGSLPGLIIAPRIYMAKGLSKDMEIIFSFFSNKLLDTLITVGAIFKYTFYSERVTWVSAGMFVGYTSSSGFTGSWKGTDIEFGAYFSKDYVRLKPYLGASMLFAHGEVPASYVQGKNSGWQTTIHFFLGMEFELPINITVQMDLMNLSPGGTLLLARRF